MTQTRFGRYANRVESAMVRYALARSPAPGVLLDVGCEGGRWSKTFAELGWEIIATDVDAKSLEVCRLRIPSARCVLADPNSHRLPAENESIDLALCIQVGPVIHAEWAVPEFARVLKRGGRLLGECWNRSSWRGFLYHNAPALRSSGLQLAAYGYPIKYKDFRRQMTEHGFQFEKELGFTWGPFRRASNSIFVSLWEAFERLLGLQHAISAAPIVAFVSQKVEVSHP